MTTALTLPTELEWLEQRRTGIGASEVAAVMGLNPYRTPQDVWRSKVYGEEPREPNRRMRYGTAFEDYVADAYAKFTGRTLVNHGRHTIFRHPEHSWLTATLDREIVHERGNGCLEIKVVQKPWAGGAPPLYYVVQLQQQMLVRGLQWGEIACYERGDEDAAPEMFAVLWQHYTAGTSRDEVEGVIRRAASGRLLPPFEHERDDEFLARALVPITRRFWFDYVMTKTPPPEGFPHE